MATGAFDVDRFAELFQQFLERMASTLVQEVPEPRLRALVMAHLGRDPAGLPVLAEQFAVLEHPNLQLALDTLLAAGEGQSVIGLPSEVRHYGDFSLGGVLAGRFHGPAEPAPIEYVNLPVDVDRSLPCAQLAVYLLRLGDVPVVAFVLRGDERSGGGALGVEVLAPERADAERFLVRLKELLLEQNVYRGKLLGFSFGQYGEFGLTFQRLPTLTRDDLILPAGDLEAIERHTVGIAEQAEVLRAAGRHLKRGLLLYGPPGTGKTLSVMYLCARMPGRTTVLLSGPGIGALGQAVALARSLQPSMVVLEDVDLVAMERTMPGMGTNPLLFELLNEMDGLAEDADVIFVLTTNRVELLEPALAARPGRIDQAVEIGLPGEESRQRLLDLYLRGVAHDTPWLDGIVERTAGVSPAFIKELVRRATMLAADEAGASLVVTAAHLDRALDDLLEHSAPILRSMLGAAYEGDAPEGTWPGGPPSWDGPPPGWVGPAELR